MMMMMMMMSTAHNRHNTLIRNWCGTKVHAVGCNSIKLSAKKYSVRSMRLDYTTSTSRGEQRICCCCVSDFRYNATIFTGLSLYSTVALGIFQKLMTLQGIGLFRDVPAVRRWSWMMAFMDRNTTVVSTFAQHHATIVTSFDGIFQLTIIKSINRVVAKGYQIKYMYILVDDILL